MYIHRYQPALLCVIFDKLCVDKYVSIAGSNHPVFKCILIAMMHELVGLLSGNWCLSAPSVTVLWASSRLPKHCAYAGGWHDDVIKREHFPRYRPFVRGIHRSPVNSPHKSQWRGALMFSLICARISGWVNTGEAGDLRRHRAHYGVIVMGGRTAALLMG